MRISDWSSDVCSSDLKIFDGAIELVVALERAHHVVVFAELIDGVAFDQADRETLHVVVEQHRIGDLLGHRRQHRVALLAIELVLLHQPVERNLDVRSEEHTSEIQSLMRISYAVFCLKNKKSR